MRRSMRKLNTFKQFQKRSVDGTDSNEIPMDELTRKFRTVELFEMEKMKKN